PLALRVVDVQRRLRVRQRDVHDGGVEDDHELRDADDGEREPAAVAAGRRRRGCGVESCRGHGVSLAVGVRAAYAVAVSGCRLRNNNGGTLRFVKRIFLPTSANGATTMGRAPRADACRNRDRLLEVASEVFTTHGVDASLEKIAKTACVGIGTLYRHYPTRDALVEAVYRHNIDLLVDQAAELSETK